MEEVIQRTPEDIVRENVSNIEFELTNVTIPDTEEGIGTVRGYINRETGDIVCFPAQGSLAEYREHPYYYEIGFEFTGTRSSNPVFKQAVYDGSAYLSKQAKQRLDETIAKLRESEAVAA